MKNENKYLILHLYFINTMRKTLTKTQCVILTLLWAALCFMILVSAPQIDGPLITMIIISGALVFIPIAKAIKTKK